MTLGRWSNFSDEDLTDLASAFEVYFMEIPDSPSERKMAKLDEEIAWERALREDLARSAA